MSLVRVLSRLCTSQSGSKIYPAASLTLERFFQTSSVKSTFTRQEGSEEEWPMPKEWPTHNYWIYPPQEPGEPRRRAECFHYRANVKYSPKKMWFFCQLVRGMSIDEAVKQLSFLPAKGAYILSEVLEEARELALDEHNFEHRSNMFVGAANCEKGLVIKGARKHAFYRMGEVRYFHCHVMVQLVEGPPPINYDPYKRTNQQKLDDYIDDLRRRNVKHTL